MKRPNLDDPIIKHARTDISPLNVGQTVGEVLTLLRQKPPENRIVYFYVVDDDNRLAGVVPTRRLLWNQPEARIADIMIPNVVAIPYTATVLYACEMFIFHKFLAFPVVDEHRHLLGVVDIELYTDEMTDVNLRTGYDDLFQLVGVRLSEARAGSPLNAFRIRFPWLLCNIAGGLLAAFLTGIFQHVLDQLIVLALFIPIVLALSESVGIQSVSLAIQSLHGQASSWRNAFLASRRELATGLLLGLGCGILVALVAWLWKGQAWVAACLLASIGVSVAASALIGMVLPLVLHLIHRDPKVAAGPIALVAADLVSLTIYFNLAQRWLL